MSQSDYLFGIDARRRGRQHAARTGSATTRWRAPTHATPDELYYSAARRRTSSAPGGTCRPPQVQNEGPRSRFPSPLDPLRRRRCATSTSGRATGSRRRRGRQIDVVGNGAPVLDRSATCRGLRSPFVDVPTTPGTGARPAPHSASSPARVPFDDARAALALPDPRTGSSSKVVTSDVQRPRRAALPDRRGRVGADRGRRARRRALVLRGRRRGRVDRPSRSAFPLDRRPGAGARASRAHRRGAAGW